MADDKQKKGFAGLDSMVSNLSSPNPPPQNPVRRSESAASSTSGKASAHPTHNAVVGQAMDHDLTVQARAKPSTINPPSRGLTGKWWAIGIGLITFIVWMSDSNKQTSSEAAAVAAQEAAAPAKVWEAPAPEAEEHAPAWEAPAPEPAAPVPDPEAEEPAPTQRYVEQAQTNELHEDVPPVGNGLIFNQSQMRYCLAEQIRINAWKGAVNDYSETSVNAFNSAVSDYNARCSHFRYRSGALESVRVSVEENRQAIMEQGLEKAAENP